MSAFSPRPVVALLLALAGIVLSTAAALSCAGAALADSEAPPPEASSHTGTLVFVGLVVIVVVVVSVLVLRGIARSRASRRIDEEYKAQRAAAEGDAVAAERTTVGRDA